MISNKLKMELTSNKNSGNGEHFHCQMCDVTVHINDRENHLKGAKHHYRIQQRESKTGHESDPPLKCSTCNTKFSNWHFFTIHKGSKTHKRNLRRAQKKLAGENRLSATVTNESGDNIEGPQLQIGTLNVPMVFNLRFNSMKKEFRPKGRRAPIKSRDSSSSLPIEAYRNISDYRSRREKYRPRNTKNPEGYNKTYICSVAAYWAISLALDENVVSFQISLNDKEWGDFGDAVVKVELKEADNPTNFTSTFAIQFKDICSNVKHIESLSEGRFALPKLLNQVNNVKSLHQSDDHIKFVVFTTALPAATMDKQCTLLTEHLHKLQQECVCDLKETSVVAKSLSNRKKLVINTSDTNDNIFFFYCTDNFHTVPRIYLYTHQTKQKHFGAEIDELVSEHLHSDYKVNIHKDFIKYIENWCDGYLGGNYKLNKEDILVKLSHMLLNKFKVVAQIKNSLETNQNYEIWQRAVSLVDVVVLSKHPVILPKVCDPINVQIERELDVRIDGTTRSIDLRQKDRNPIEKIKNPILKMYLFEETVGELSDNIPLDVVYDFFWKAGLTPLVLQVKNMEEQHQVLDIISIVKTLGLTRRYLLITPDEDPKNSLKYHIKSLTFFITLDDIARELSDSMLNDVKINVTEKFSVSLRDIQQSDRFFQKTVTTHEFFDMSLGNYSFKSFGNNLARKDGKSSQIVLDDDVLKRLKEEIDFRDEKKGIWFGQNESQKDGMPISLRDIDPNLFAFACFKE